MTKIELIMFAILSTISVLVAFDFIVYVIKSGPKTSYLTKRTWFIGLIAIMAMVYWYMNGMRFILNVQLNLHIQNKLLSLYRTN